MNNTIQGKRSLETTLVLNLYGNTVSDSSSHTVDHSRVNEVT